MPTNLRTLTLASVLLAVPTGAWALDGKAMAVVDPIMRSGFEDNECVGLECAQVGCPQGSTTRITGVVYAPNGTLPLPGVTVFVPNAPLEPFLAGAQCTRCGTPPSGSPLVMTESAADGSFALDNVPVGTEFPLVVQTGKWRRQTSIQAVTACATTPLPASAARLPRNASEGDLPLVAISTGGADPIECLLRKAGISDSAFSIAGGAGRVHLFAGSQATDAFDAANGGQQFAASSTLWASSNSLRVYDQVMIACEFSQVFANKPASALQAMKDYADLGGRVYLSHFQNLWIQSGPAPWDTVATFNFQGPLGGLVADVNTSFPRGLLLANWLVHVGASSSVGTMPLGTSPHTLTSVNETLARKWLYKDVTANNAPTVQYFSFNAPIEAQPAQRCGRVIFSELHVDGGDTSSSSLAFPSGGCTSPLTSLTPKEKALLFMLFDLGSCVGSTIE